MRPDNMPRPHLPEFNSMPSTTRTTPGALSAESIFQALQAIKSQMNSSVTWDVIQRIESRAREIESTRTPATQTNGDVEAIEAAAKAIYEHWQFKTPKNYPWIPGGNSTKQDEARSYAVAALSAAHHARKPKEE